MGASGGGGLTPLGVAVLSLLVERPMHPYDMYTTLMERHADRLVKVRPGSLYHAVQRLDRDGLVRSTGVERTGGRPERTTYAITEPGRSSLAEWTRATLTDPPSAYPHFPFALAEAHNLPGEDVRELLGSLLQRIDDEIEQLAAVTAGLAARPLAEAYWIEVSYLLAMRRAERDWLTSTVQRLQEGDLTWPR